MDQGAGLDYDYRCITAYTPPKTPNGYVTVTRLAQARSTTPQVFCLSSVGKPFRAS